MTAQEKRKRQIKKLMKTDVYPIPLPYNLAYAWLENAPEGWIAGYPRKSADDERICVRAEDANLYLADYGRR